MKKISSIILSALSLACCGNPESCVVGNLDIYENFESKHVEARPVRVWTPSDYNPEQKYDVIYMHDGQNLFDSSITWNHQEWGVDECMSRLIADGEIRPCIVVGMDNISEIRYEEYYPTAICPTVPEGVLPEGFNHSLKHKKAQSRQVCYFRKDELGAGDVTFTVTPMNCFGARGKPLITTFKA